MIQEQLDTATAAATWFEAFIKHASVVSILLALFGSWGATHWAKFPIYELAPDKWEGWLIRTFCSIVAGAIAAFTWPNSWAGAWALTIGFASPTLYWLALKLVYKYWPWLGERQSAQRGGVMTSKGDADPTDEAGT